MMRINKEKYYKFICPEVEGWDYINETFSLVGVIGDIKEREKFTENLVSLKNIFQISPRVMK